MEQLIKEKRLQAPFSEESMTSASDDVIKINLPNFKVLSMFINIAKWWDHKAIPISGIYVCYT